MCLRACWVLFPATFATIIVTVDVTESSSRRSHYPLQKQKTVVKDSSGDTLPEGAIYRLGTPRLQHPGGVIGHAFFPDGMQLASIGKDGTLRIWDTTKGLEKLVIHVPKGVKAVAVAGDGKTVASGHDGGKLCLWAADSGNQIKVFDEQGKWCSKLAISPDGKALASLFHEVGGFTNMALWDTNTWKLKQDVKQSAFLVCLAFTHDSQKLATSDNGGNIQVWDVGSGRLERQITNLKKSVLSLAWSPDSKSMLVGLASEDAIVINSNDGSQLMRLKPQRVDQAPLAVAASPDGTLFATAGFEGVVQLVDAKTGDVSGSLPGNIAGPPLSFSPDGKTIAGASGSSMYLWDVQSRKLLIDSEVPANILAAIPSHDNQQLLIQAKDLPLSLWDIKSNKKVPGFKELRTRFNSPFAISADGKYIADCESNGETYLRRFDTGQIVQTFKSPGGGEPVTISLSADSKLLATTSVNRGSAIVIWDVKTGKEVKRFGYQFGALAEVLPSNFSFSLDSKSFAIGDHGNDVAVYSVTTGALDWQHAFGKVESYEYNPIPHFVADGELLAVGGGRSVSLWHLATKKRVFQDGACAWGFDCSRDGRLLATVARDHSIRIWEIASRTLLTKFPGHGNPCYPYFSRDGKTLVSGGGSALIWKLWRTPARGGEGKPGELAGKIAEEYWTRLTKADAANAYEAMAAFIDAGDAGVAFLKSQLTPANAADLQPINSLIDQLGSDKFAVREAAAQELKKLGRIAEHSIANRLQEKLPLEVRQRLMKALEEIPVLPVSGQALRQVRAIHVLELISTDNAKTLLRSLAAGDGRAWQTQQCMAACKRLGI